MPPVPYHYSSVIAKLLQHQSAHATMLIMTSNNYNSRKLADGSITVDQISTLVHHWQATHGLVVDGKLGENTARSIKSRSVGVSIGLRALEYARQDIGKGETYSNNRSTWLDSVRSQDGTGLGWRDYKSPWCASVLSYWFVKAIKSLGIGSAWASSRHARTLGRHLANKARTLDFPEPGAIGVYSRGIPGSGNGHAVIFESYAPNTDTAVSIEGNVGSFPSKVKRVTKSDGLWRRKLLGIYSL